MKQPETRLAYSKKHAAQLLDVCEATISQLIQCGYIKPWLCGRLVRIRHADLEALLQVDISTLFETREPFPESRPGYQRPEAANG